jgi:hypothetical protein
MNYIEAVRLVSEIESKYDLMKVTYKDVSIWPLLRINIIDSISGNNETMKSSGGSAIKQVLETLFYYNPIKYFTKKNIWLFSGFERRKDVCGQKMLRVSGCVLEAHPNTLVIEKPSKDQKNTPRKSIPEKNIVSESWLLFFVHAYVILSRWFRIKVQNEDILRNMLNDYNIKFDYIGSIRLLIAQKIIFDLLLKITHKPNKVIIECPYTIMGYIWSLHSNNIPVIELQHGVLNDKHYAYNSLFTSKILYPDEICVFGDDEYNYIKSDACHYCDKVHKTGLYYLELAKNSFTDDVFKKYRNRYEHIILVAGQKGYEDVLAEYVRTAANITPKSLYIYVPRTNDAKLIFNQENIKYCPGINIYEYMIWCDVHLTISSTTCLECQYYKKPTIFYNYADLSVNYYGKVLKPENGVVFTESVKQLESAIKQVFATQYRYKEIFAGGTVEKIKKIIEE